MKRGKVYGPATREASLVATREEAGVCPFGPLQPSQDDILQQHIEENARKLDADAADKELKEKITHLTLNSGFTPAQREAFRMGTQNMLTHDAVTLYHKKFTASVQAETQAKHGGGNQAETQAEHGRGNQAETRAKHVSELAPALCSKNKTDIHHVTTTVFLFIAAVFSAFLCFLVNYVTISMLINFALPLVACGALRYHGSSGYQLPFGVDIGMTINKYCALCMFGSMAGALILASTFGDSEYTPYVQKVGTAYNGLADSASAAIDAGAKYASSLSVKTGVVAFIVLAVFALLSNNRSMKPWLFNPDNEISNDKRTAEHFKESESTGPPEYVGRWHPQVMFMLAYCILLLILFANYLVDVQQPRITHVFETDTTPSKQKATKVLYERTGLRIKVIPGGKGAFPYVTEMKRVCLDNIGFKGYGMANNDKTCGRIPMRKTSTKDDRILVVMSRTSIVGPQKPLLASAKNSTSWNVNKPMVIRNKQILESIDETDLKNQNVRLTGQIHLVSPMYTALLLLIFLWRLARPILAGKIPIEEADAPANAIVDVLTFISILVIAINMVGPLVPTALTMYQKCIAFAVLTVLFLICQSLWAARDLLIKMLTAAFGRNNRFAESLTKFLLTITVNVICAFILAGLVYYVYVNMDCFELTNTKLDEMIPSWISPEWNFSIKGFFLDDVKYMPASALTPQ